MKGLALSIKEKVERMKKRNKFVPFIVLLLFFVSILPFVVNLNDQFVSDDWDFLYVADERAVSLNSYLFTNTVGTNDGGTYRPLVNIFWSVGYQLFGLDSFGYHATTTFFHGINVVLIFLLLYYLPWFKDQKTKISIGLIASILFIVLPNHSEGVAWVAVIHDTVVTFFYLLTLLLLLLAGRFDRFRLAFYIGSLFAFIIALFAKEMAITLPGTVFIFLVSDSLYKKRRWFSALKLLTLVLPYALILVLYFWIRYQTIGLLFGDYVHHSFVLTKEMAWRAYSSIFFSNFLVGNVRSVVTSFFIDHRVLTGWLAGLYIFFGFIFSIKKRSSWFFWSVFGVFLISIIPVIRFGVNATPIYFSAEGERYAYFPSVFFAIMASFLFVTMYNFFKNKPPIYRFVLSGCLIIFILLSGAELITKNLRWHEASQIVDRTIDSAVSLIEDEEYEGIVFVGMPDNYHGAFIFRNAFYLALPRFLPERPDIAKDMIITTNRSLYQPGEEFVVERINNKLFQYQSAGNKQLVVSEPKVENLDYSSELKNNQRELMSISYRDYGTGLLFELSDSFVSHNLEMNKKIGVLFFSGGRWIPFSIYEN